MRPDVTSVVHVHPEHAVLLTIARKEIIQVYNAFDGSASLARESIPVYPSSRTIASTGAGRGVR